MIAFAKFGDDKQTEVNSNKTGDISLKVDKLLLWLIVIAVRYMYTLYISTKELCTMDMCQISCHRPEWAVHFWETWALHRQTTNNLICYYLLKSLSWVATDQLGFGISSFIPPHLMLGLTQPKQQMNTICIILIFLLHICRSGQFDINSVYSTKLIHYCLRSQILSHSSRYRANIKIYTYKWLLWIT